MTCRSSLRVFAVACLLLADAARATDELCLDDAAVCIEAVQEESATRFFVRNDTEAPYSVRVSFEDLENLRATKPLPFRAVVRAGEKHRLGSLDVSDPSKATRFRYVFRAALGSALARPDKGFQYRMPFGGDRARVLSQGVGGRHSHQGSSRHAFDFAMPWGTPVLAARDGVVVEVVDGHGNGGVAARFHDKANRVTVLHADGSLAMYAHLRRGARVATGDRVRVGDTLGASGDTGFSTGPHLHFMVWRRRGDLRRESLPIRFHDGSPEGIVPSEGVAYAPACASSGAGCRGDAPLPQLEAPTPAAPAQPPQGATRRPDGACACPNGAVIHVDLPCRRVCGE